METVPNDVKIGQEACTTNYCIAAGKGDGIAADSGAAVPARSPTREGSAIGRIGRVASVEPVVGCRAVDFAEGTNDCCMYTCGEKYQVTTIDSMILFSPQRTFVSQKCICHNGMGFQVGLSENFYHAMVSLDGVVRSPRN